MPLEKFTLEPRLMLVCRICDDSGTELEFKDYKEKGTTLKVVTEEITQEVTKIGKRYFVNPERYWDPLTYEEEVVGPGPLYNSYTKAQVAAYLAANPTLPTNTILSGNKNIPETILSYMEAQFNKGVNGLIKDTEPTYEVLADTKFSSGKSPDVCESGISSVVEKTVFRNTIITHNFAPITNEPLPDTITPTGVGRYTHITAIERYNTHDKYVEDPYVEISIPEDTRHFQAYETYAKKLPSRVYKTSIKEGLNGGLLKLINDPVMKKYDKLNKIIIDKNVAIELKAFNGHYTIAESTWAKLFARYKDVEILNNLITVIFPAGDLELDKLKLMDCTILSNNTTVKVGGDFTMNACTIGTNGSDGKMKSISFNIKNNLDIKTLTIIGMVKLSILTSEKDKTANLSKIDYNFAYSGADAKKSTPIISIIGFSDVTIMDITKGEKCQIPNCVLIKIAKPSKLKLMNIDAGLIKHSIPLVDIDGGTDLKISNFTDKTGSTVGASINISNMKPEAKIKISDSNIIVSKFLALSSCIIGDFQITETKMTVDKIFSLIDTEPFSKFNTSSKTEITFNNSVDLIISEGSFDDTKFNCVKGSIGVGKSLSISTCLFKIKEDFSIKLHNNDSIVNFKDTPITCGNDLKIYSKSTTNGSKLEMIKSIVESKTFEVGELQIVDFQYSPIACIKATFDGIKTLKAMEAPLRVKTLRSFTLTNVAEMPTTGFNVEGSGDLIVTTTNCFGSLKFIIIDGSVKMTRITKDSGICDRHEYGEKVYNLTVNSSGCSSSAIILDKISSLIVLPISLDFKLFKVLDPLNFSEGSVGKKLYDRIDYGPDKVV